MLGVLPLLLIPGVEDERESAFQPFSVTIQVKHGGFRQKEDYGAVVVWAVSDEVFSSPTAATASDDLSGRVADVGFTRGTHGTLLLCC